VATECHPYKTFISYLRILSAETSAVTTLEPFAIVFSKVTETHVLEIVRSHRIEAASVENAGVKVQDILQTIDGYPVNNLPAAGTRLFMRSGGDQIKLGVLRGTTRLNLVVPVVEVQNDLDSLASVVQSNQSPVSQLGVVVIDIDPTTARKFPSLRIGSGVLVAARAIDSNADVALEAGDVIHTLNGTSVKTSEELRAALNHLGPNSPVVLQIERAGKLMFVAFKSADTK
jgi:S1-C subfamily serine protease